ncbi:uncharacterized protein LOC111278718 isoform X2 [Durio zibethinus]|uniref:Uncharacterized protein LOC111278718 isoform X2 n=1 Tax=Durio zibethinus TaxID=66656 RepID=A0A6P5WYT4_DURZI|nr:uncharacterized protein LOC111278718 isoform X2 [Durio zibethinus]
MMLKFFAFFLFATALSCWKLEGFPTLETQDFNLSEPVLQGQEIHVFTHSNRTVGLGAKDDKQDYQKKHQNFLSKKSKGGRSGGGRGGADIGHRPRPAKNAAFSLVSQPFFLSTAVMHISLTVILAFPSLVIKLF